MVSPVKTHINAALDILSMVFCDFLTFPQTQTVKKLMKYCETFGQIDLVWRLHVLGDSSVTS